MLSSPHGVDTTCELSIVQLSPCSFTPISPFEDTSYHKPAVHHEGWQVAIMRRHDVKTLFERCLVILIGHAAIQIIRHHSLHIAQWQVPTSRFFHDSYAPINIGRIAILRQVRRNFGNVGACIKSLMAHQHAV